MRTWSSGMNADSRRHAKCPTCGYNVHGLQEDRCPECGREFDRWKIQGRAWPPLGLSEWVAVWMIAVVVATSALSYLIQRIGWPSSGPGSREWIVHDNNITSVPSYVPLTVWLPLSIAVAGMATIGLWLRRRLLAGASRSSLAMTKYTVIAAAVLVVQYACFHWAALCCD